MSLPKEFVFENSIAYGALFGAIFLLDYASRKVSKVSFRHTQPCDVETKEQFHQSLLKDPFFSLSMVTVRLMLESSNLKPLWLMNDKEGKFTVGEWIQAAANGYVLFSIPTIHNRLCDLRAHGIQFQGFLECILQHDMKFHARYILHADFRGAPALTEACDQSPLQTISREAIQQIFSDRWTKLSQANGMIAPNRPTLARNALMLFEVTHESFWSFPYEARDTHVHEPDIIAKISQGYFTAEDARIIKDCYAAALTGHYLSQNDVISKEQAQLTALSQWLPRKTNIKKVRFSDLYSILSAINEVSGHVLDPLLQKWPQSTVELDSMFSLQLSVNPKLYCVFLYYDLKHHGTTRTRDLSVILPSHEHLPLLLTKVGTEYLYGSVDHIVQCMESLETLGQAGIKYNQCQAVYTTISGNIRRKYATPS